MNLKLLNATSKEETYCCRSGNNKGLKNGINTLVLFFMLVLGHAVYAVAPSISSFAPATRATGQTVTITGANFTAVTGVFFGNTPASTFTVVNSTTITAVVGNGSSGSVKVTTVGGIAQKTGFTFVPAPSCNLSGILKQCLSAGNIAITTTIQFAGSASPDVEYDFPAGAQNTTGASIVSEGPISYDALNDVATQTVIINPGTSGGQINFQLLVSTPGGLCECSKSITIVDVGLELSNNPINCFGGTTSLFADANSSGSSNYTFTLNPGNITVGPQSNPSVEFQNIAAGDYTVIVTDNNGCFKQQQITIEQPPFNPVVLNCPSDKTETSCKTQAEINASFAEWLASFSYTGGTNPTMSISPNAVAPLACGTASTSVQVTWTVEDECGEPKSCTRTFTVTPAPTVIVGTPDSKTVSSCDYTNQESLNTVFNSWLAGFTVSGGCNPSGTHAQVSAPNFCLGGTTTVTYNVVDRCYTNTITKTFTVNPAPHVEVTGPANVNATSCTYADQDAVNTAFNAWVAQFQTVSTGCGASAQFNISEFGAPNLCQGGSVSLTYSIADNCTQDSATATFSITPSTPVNVVGPDSITSTSCDFDNQEAVNAEFNAWLAEFQTISAGCGATAQFNASEFQAPNLCLGGVVTLTYSIADNCTQDSATATFSITPTIPVNVNGPESVASTSCDYADQAAVNAAFNAWVAQFQTVSAGCGATAQFNTSEYQAPNLCLGGSVSLTYSIADN
ncbi:MAG: hypothetical protein RL427_21, partial [Bacteroidota bacterium]